MFLFKKIYNLSCSLEKQKDNDNETGKIYQIQPDEVNSYKLNDCINNNIIDNNSRYLLLEIEPNIAPLINRIIEAQSSYRKKVNTIIGSPFSDDKNSDYRARKVNEIQNFASQEDKLIILQNLDSIQPYLYDLYNMNYKVIDDQKFVRICLENFSEQLTPVSDSFRIIVLTNKRFVNKIDMAFLNRLEKMQIQFEELLDNTQEEKQRDLIGIINEIEKKIRLKEEIEAEREKFNYDLDSLLINCNRQDIGGLVYYLFLENKKQDFNKDNIKDIIYTKISKLLPQDIAIILPEDNPIKMKYYEKKKYYNFQQYMKDLNANNKDLINYKISIIYTYSNIINIIEGYNHDEFMISAVSSEEKLKTQIDDIKNKNKNDNKRGYILIKFEDYNSNKIQFIADYIKTYCENDEYHYIFIIYLHRNMDSDDYEPQIIYSTPNINKNINQLFIDNLAAPEIKLEDLLKNDIKEIMFSANNFKNLDKEFRQILSDFVYEKMEEKTKIELNQTSKMSDLSTFLTKTYGENKNNSKGEAYSDQIINYMMYIDPDFKDKIINKAKELIKTDKIAQKDCPSLINKMLSEKYVNKDKIDIISCILGYIKEKIFTKYLRIIFNVLEDNNFLTTLLELNNEKCKVDKNRSDNDEIIKELETTFLKEIKVENEKNYEPKFLSNFKIPGFYNFYKKLSDYLTKDIITEFFDNENNLRDNDIDEGTNVAKIIEDFHEKEDELLKKVLDFIEKDKLYKDFINKITPDLILKDYIIFYLEKNLGIYSKPFYNIISFLLYLRFSDKKNIIIKNIENPINIVLIKIMWIESNTYYIENILKAFELGKRIINDNEGLVFYQRIYDSIYDKENPITYIANKNRPEHMKEVNECFYLFLAGLSLNVTTNDMDKIESIGTYCGILKDIYKIVKNIDDDLYTYLNELYIIDELIIIIDYNPNTKKKVIEDIRNYLSENAKIIQKNQYNKNDKLIENFKNMNERIKAIKNDQTKNKFYTTLKYIYKKEIEKINDKVYCSAILEEIIKEKEIIKISNDIFQILLDYCTDTEKFGNLKDELLESKDNIIKLLDKKLSDANQDYYIALSDTLIYFFENYSLIYLNDFSDVEKFVEEKVEEEKGEEEKGEEEEEEKKGEHLTIFKECCDFLYEFNNDEINEGLTYITQLFCIAYIKSFCSTFIDLHKKKKFNPENIIKIINESDKINMVKLYIYKTIYNKNNKQINSFLNSDIIKKYKLNTYNGFNEFINKEEVEKLDEFSYDDNKSKTFKKLKEYEEKHFEEKISKNDISSGKKDFDDFYMAAYKLILSKLNNEDFEKDNSYTNFYSNVCEPLYTKDKGEDKKNKLIILMKFFFDKEKYKEIKKEYSINSEDIDALLYGYRYCLNEVVWGAEKEKIYSYLYNRSNLSDFDQKFYPGNDNNKDEPYYELYSKIKNHFKEKPEEGCFVCLCNKGYYHSVTSGFPDFQEINMKCPYCNYEIGAKEYFREEFIEENGKTKTINIKVYQTVKSNSHYYRIFKDEEEIEKLKKSNESKFEKLNYMTIEKFKDQYIEPLYSKEKGLNKIDINNVKKDNRIVRNLSQISFRLLNYILYCHLFFAKLFTNSPRFDDYLPDGMKWIPLIKELLTKLKVELEKIGIKNLEIFMNCVFKDLFDKLHKQNCINNIEDLFKFEEELEKLIQEKCQKAEEEINKYKELEIKIIKDEKSGIALIKEIYDKSKYDRHDFPYYEYFYYTDYLNEDYIINLLQGKDDNNYPVLFNYLKNQKESEDDDNEDKYSLDNLDLFNKVLKLFNDFYSNQIPRNEAERQKIVTSDIYRKDDNAKLIDKFIKLYNNFELQNAQGNKLVLNKEKNSIIDFLLIDDNEYGKSYRIIYKEFINRQNSELESLLDKKIDSGEFNPNCKNKVSIQQIKENEIFSLNEESEFTKVLFNSSYRKYIDTNKHENYNDYEIRWNQIESEMTDSLLKNKKLLNDDIKEFNFNNEVFSHEITELISNFNYKTNSINPDEQVIIYNYIIKDNAGNLEKYKTMINNFITLIEYLNKASKDENNKISDSTKISDIDIIKNKKNVSDDFVELFQDKNNSNVNFNVSKITNIFDYFLKLIFKYVKEDIEKHQEEKDKKGNIKKKILDEMFKTDMIIKKEDLSSAIRIFITLVLFRENENDKDTKIKTNKKNIIDYLKNKDLWDSTLYNNKSRFETNLLKIKELNIKIREILFFYYYLVDEKDEGFEDKVVKYIEKKEEEARLIKEREDKIKKDEDDTKGKKGKKDESSDEEEEDAKKKKKKKGKPTKGKGKNKNKKSKKVEDDSDESD